MSKTGRPIQRPDQWFKTLYTDEEGRLSLSLPWDGQYVIETVYTEDRLGTFERDDYEAIRHTATFNIPPQVNN